MSCNFFASVGLMALLDTAAGNYVEYTTYENGGCVTALSVSVYAGVPTVNGVQTADMCLEYEGTAESTSVPSSLTDQQGLLSLMHVCNTTDPGQLTSTWYSTDDCDETAVAYEFREDATCGVSCTDVEPDYGSDDFEEATITFYDTSDCSNATDTEVYAMVDLYELFEVADGTPCSASGDFDLYTVIQCSDGSPAAVYYEDATCTGDAVGMTYNPGCAAVPSNGTYPGDYFMAECTEETAAVEDDDTEVEDDDVDGATNSAFSRFGLGSTPAFSMSCGVAAASVAMTTTVFFARF
ncbi:unnamed protein product [Ectocarpus sp. CCAP 1310/34]|nr:unnamed protein product [Ectocarpus sp. CCAP 1310/34]